ncbi:MAG: decaprenyl-phosphate phosphoribosyltransferase [Streptosporangiaceae bacterium]
MITQTQPARPANERPVVRAARWLKAVIRTTRPRQWPKNLLVFAAPLAAASLGRNNGLAYAMLGAFAFLCASAAVYLVNDAVDAERDRQHPKKRLRPIASGELPPEHAIAVGVGFAVIALAAGPVAGVPWLSATTGAYLAMSFLYSGILKHIPVVEVIFVASGFLLRVVGGAVVTHVRLSLLFLLVCSLGALGVAVAKRYSELVTLGEHGIKHRPTLAHYTPAALRLSQILIGAAMIATYLLWAASEKDTTRLWHIASAIPLAAALFRFGVLTGKHEIRPVEDMITRDALMLACEAAWLALFVTGLYA